MRRCYLAGGIRTDWREYVKTHLGDAFEWLEPKLKGEYPTDPLEFTVRDLFLVDQADIVFAYVEAYKEQIPGTAAEIGYAKGKGKVVIFVVDKDNPNKERFNFLTALADITFDDLEAGMRFLESLSERF